MQPLVSSPVRFEPAHIKTSGCETAALLDHGGLWAADEDMEEAGPSGRGVAVDASGAPVPLHPALVTLALLPRSQWQGLVHLDAIKVSFSSAVCSVQADTHIRTTGRQQPDLNMIHLTSPMHLPYGILLASRICGLSW